MENNLKMTCALVLMSLIYSTVCAEQLPDGVIGYFPNDHVSMVFKSGDFNGDGKLDFVVVVRAKNEGEIVRREGTAPRRPLLVFLQNYHHEFILVGRNDAIVYAADEGGQCDPFLDSEEGLAIKGAFFTVQNAVACGQHWTDYVTFRYAEKYRGFVFHKRIHESWKMNSSGMRDADALVLEKRNVEATEGRKPASFSDYVLRP
jgi:hypothetical protein